MPTIVYIALTMLLHMFPELRPSHMWRFFHFDLVMIIFGNLFMSQKLGECQYETEIASI